MKELILICLLLTSLTGQPPVEAQVIGRVQQMLDEEGRVTFSTLYNSSKFSTDERAFLGRLYEIFFAIPGFLQTQYTNTGKIPSCGKIANHFSVSRQAVTLLLAIMEADARVPELCSTDPETGEITTLNLPNIERFLQQRGGEVQVTQWKGRTLPAFQVSTPDNKIVSNDQLLDQNSLIYFWFTGCPPCVKIAPILSGLAEKYRSTGFKFYSFNADKLLGIERAEKTRQSYHRKHEHRFINADLNKETRAAFGNVNVYPTLFFVDEGGMVCQHFVNFQSRETLVAVIERMLE